MPRLWAIKSGIMLFRAVRQAKEPPSVDRVRPGIADSLPALLLLLLLAAVTLSTSMAIQSVAGNRLQLTCHRSEPTCVAL